MHVMYLHVLHCLPSMDEPKQQMVVLRRLCQNDSNRHVVENGVFASLDVTCPNGKNEVLQVDESWPQDELGRLEGMLPMLCENIAFGKRRRRL